MSKYGFTLRPSFALWTLFAVAIRIPNASAPLAMVFLGHGATGTYASGAVLAAAFVLGEVAGSAALGWLGRDDRVRRDVTIGLAVGAVGFGILSVGAGAPFWLLIIGALIAGAGPAQSGGALRAALGRIVPEADLARAYSVDSVVTEVVWLVAPALVAAAAVLVSPFAVLILNAALLVVAVLLAVSTGGKLLAPDEGGTEVVTSRKPLLRAWPVYVTSAAALSLMAVAELVLPSLLEYRGYSAGWSGPLLAAFAGASAISALVYGARTWAGSARMQSFVLLLATALSLVGMAIAPSAALIGVALVFAGVSQAVVMITRNLTLRGELPAALHTSGFTLMYSVQGAGYAISAILASAVLDRNGAPAAIGTGIALMAALTIVSVTAEALRRPRRGQRPTTAGSA